MFRERSDGRRERGRSNDSPQQSGRRSLARKDEDERRRSGAELENLQGQWRGLEAQTQRLLLDQSTACQIIDDRLSFQ